MNAKLIAAGLSALLAVCSLSARGADWPTYLMNNQRNAVTDEKLALPLTEVWAHQPRHAPQPTWPPPAPKRNLFRHGGKEIPREPRSTLGRAYQVVVAGNSLYYASPANHAVICVDVRTGKPRWSFFTEAPVRLAPSMHDGKVYFGSDDGHVYCLDAAGKQVWKSSIGPEGQDRRLPGNGHMISLWPVRSSVLVEGEAVYACAGLFPFQGTYRCALDRKTGKRIWQVGGPFSYGNTSPENPAQGYLVSLNGKILVPTGRTAARAFGAKDGKKAKTGASASSGTYIVAGGKTTFFQDTRNVTSLGVSGLEEKRRTRFFPASLVVARGGLTYFHGKREISAMRFEDYDKKLKDAVLWRRKLSVRSRAYSMIMSGDVIFAGRDGAVAAISAADGKDLWSGPVAGKVYDLAVAGGRLYASTDKGIIHCFMPGQNAIKSGNAPAAPRQPSGKDPSAGPAVERILKQLSARQGYCLVLGARNESLLRELAGQTRFKIIAVESDEKYVARLRRSLDASGLYGRIAAHHASSKELPYPQYFANLVVIGEATAAPKEVCRVLRPYGGVAVMADGASPQTWLKGALPAGGRFAPSGALQRGALPGAGEWTHQYATPDNRATSNDPYVRGPLAPLWFGAPGPREMVDRHNCASAPLFKDGRLFIPAKERIIAIDAYNGTRLWDLDVPGSRRMGIPKDSSQMAVAADAVYIAVKGECWGINTVTGKRSVTLKVPSTGEKREWGYLAVLGGRAIGTAQRPGASFNEPGEMHLLFRKDFKPMIISTGIFSVDRKSGAKQWHYSNGAILNSGIAIGDGRVYLLEARNVQATGNKKGRLSVDKFLGGSNFLVALDLETGAKRWEQPVKLSFHHGAFLYYAEGKVLALGCYNRMREIKGKKAKAVHYGLYAFKSDTGKAEWNTEFMTNRFTNDVHGMQWRHPVIIGSEILGKGIGCDLNTGKRLPFPPGGYCSISSSSASATFYRAGNIRMFDLNRYRGQGFNVVSRSGCYLNLIPAGGILSVPESSSSCICKYSLQTSLAYVPTQGLAPFIRPFAHKHGVHKFASALTISLGPIIPGAAIHYTLDGSVPSAKSPKYTAPFAITKTTTVRARLLGPVNASPAVVSKRYVKSK